MSFRPLIFYLQLADTHILCFLQEYTMQPRRALIVIDVQNEYFDGNLPIEYPSTEISLPNITRAMDAAQANDIPVILVQHDAPEASPVFALQSHGWQLHPDIVSRKHALHLNKQFASAFTGTALKAWLETNDIDTLTIVGYMTHNCDASTIIEARHLGYQVEFLSDATGALPYTNEAGSVSARQIHETFSVVFHTGFAAVASTAAWIDAVNTAHTLPISSIPASNLLARQLQNGQS
jgi:nicotinamidase-related amidase